MQNYCNDGYFGANILENPRFSTNHIIEDKCNAIHEKQF